MPIAIACFVLAAVETSAIGRMFAQKHEYRLDPNQELLALGASNLLSGLGRGFPVSGGMSQSLVNESAGARTPVSGLVATLFTLIVVLFASGLLRNLPQPVLAGIVLAAVMSLVDVKALRHIWTVQPDRIRRRRRRISWRARIRAGQRRPARRAAVDRASASTRSAGPRVTELGRIPRTANFGDRERHPENERVPGVLVVRCESALLYFNVEHVRERVLALLGAREDRMHLVVFFLGTVPAIDLAGAELLTDFTSGLAASGTAFRLADAHGNVRDALRRIDFERDYGPLETGQTIDVVVLTVAGRWRQLEP